MIKHHTSNDSQFCQSGEWLIKQHLTLGKLNLLKELLLVTSRGKINKLEIIKTYKSITSISKQL